MKHIGPGTCAQCQSLVDEGAIKTRVFTRAQNGVEQFERRLIGVSAVRNFVGDDDRAQLAWALENHSPLAALRRFLGVDRGYRRR